MTTTTASMQQFGVPSTPDGARRGGMSAGLVLLYSADFERLAPAYPLTAHQVYIGREPSCAICVSERAVSRKHSLVEFVHDQWVLRDLGGSNGTLVDGRPIDEIVLEPNHEVRVGDTIFKFVPTGAEEYVPYRSDGEMVVGATRRSSALMELRGGMQIDRIGAQLERIAPADLSVIIQGESGTGKEVVAREIHRLSGRRGPLQAVNCAAIPANLIESELFGYKRGAFSGADRDKLGLLAAAHTGTLLLDEIGDMPLEAQAKLLRVLQSREIFPVGATSGQKIDVRVICATNRDLSRLVKADRFRGDLLARLNEFHIVLPPLRDRKEDIYLLCRTLLERHGFARLQLSFPVILALLHYDWPYNVRELESCLKRCAALADSDLLTERHLPEAVREAMVSYGSKRPKGEASKPSEESTADGPAVIARRSTVPTEEELRALLSMHGGNVAAVGRELGKERMQIHRWMQRYGIVPDEYRS